MLYSNRAERVSHILVDDVRRIVANDIYQADSISDSILKLHLNACKFIIEKNTVTDID